MPITVVVKVTTLPVGARFLFFLPNSDTISHLNLDAKERISLQVIVNQGIQLCLSKKAKANMSGNFSHISKPTWQEHDGRGRGHDPRNNCLRRAAICLNFPPTKIALREPDINQRHADRAEADADAPSLRNMHATRRAPSKRVLLLCPLPVRKKSRGRNCSYPC